MDELYKEMILELYRHPRNKGLLANASHSKKGFNPTCGDEITVYVSVQDGKIKDARYTGDGCAISQAAVSLVTDEIKGKSIAEVQEMNKDTINRLLGVEITPTRLKCSLLGLETIQKALNQE